MGKCLEPLILNNTNQNFLSGVNAGHGPPLDVKMTTCPEFLGKANGMVVMAHGPLPELNNCNDTDLNFLTRSMVVNGHFPSKIITMILT